MEKIACVLELDNFLLCVNAVQCGPIMDKSCFCVAAAHAALPIQPRQQATPRRRHRQRDGGVGTAVALNRILFEKSEVGSSGDIVLPRNDFRAAHIHEVLRLPATGGGIRAGVVNQYLVDDVPVTINDDLSIKLSLFQGKRKPLPQPPAVSLILALPRPKVLSRLLPQMTAVGVREIVLCNAYKVERCYFDSTLLTRPKEIRTLLIEGASQCGNDCRLPTVTVEKRLKIFLEDRLNEIAPEEANLLIAEPGTSTSLFSALKLDSCSEGQPCSQRCRKHTVVAVGPEGGWMPREVNMFEHDFGFQRVSLGNRILRTDAAVLILLGLINEHYRFVSMR